MTFYFLYFLPWKLVGLMQYLVFSGFCWSHSPRLRVTATTVPTVTGITVAFSSTSSPIYTLVPGISLAFNTSSYWYSCNLELLRLSPLQPSVSSHHSVQLISQSLLLHLDLEVPQELLPCYFPWPSEESPIFTWKGLVHIQHRYSCIRCQLLGTELVSVTGPLPGSEGSAARWHITLVYATLESYLCYLSWVDFPQSKWILSFL